MEGGGGGSSNKKEIITITISSSEESDDNSEIYFPTPPEKNIIKRFLYGPKDEITPSNSSESTCYTSESSDSSESQKTLEPSPDKILDLTIKSSCSQIVKKSIFSSPSTHVLDLSKKSEALPTLIQKNEKINLILCSSRLSKAQLKSLNSVATLHGAKILTKFSPEVTHLVINLEDGMVPKTMKFYMAIAHKKWILSFDWILDSLEKGVFVNEEPFETSNLPNCDPGPYKSRLSPQKLFSTIKFYIIGRAICCSASLDDCKTLLEALGGLVLKEIPSDPDFCAYEQLLIIGDPSSKRQKEACQKLFNKYEWITVSWEWVMDSLLSYSIIKLKTNYLLCDVGEQLLTQLKLPLLLCTSFSTQTNSSEDSIN